MYNSIDVCQLLVQFVMAVNYRYISLQNGSQFGEGQFEQRMSSTYGSQGRVAGSLLLFWFEARMFWRNFGATCLVVNTLQLRVTSSY